MTITNEKWFIIVGWITYTLTWVALFANIVNDWLTRRWISPLSIMMLVIFGGGTAIQLLRRKPIINTKGMANRFLITIILVLLIWVFILGRIVLNFLVN